MLIIDDGQYHIEEGDAIFAHEHRLMRGRTRKVIEITIPEQEGVDYDMLVEAFHDGASIMREVTKTVMMETSDGEEEVPETTTYDLTNYVVAGDIVDKRDGTFTVFMCEKTEAEILDESMAEMLLIAGGAE